MSYASTTRVRSSLYFVIAVAQCSCFGDPHCLSFDDSRLDFQGDCQYVLSTNKCNDTAVGPPFEVLAVFSDRGVPTSAPATWVEEVTVNVYDYVSSQPCQYAVSGHHRPASKTPFKWRFACRKMVSKI